MTDLQIDEALALAIGWKRERTHASPLYFWVKVSDDPKDFTWRRFSHKDPAVIWPIAERFDCFPVQDVRGQWFSALVGNGRFFEANHTNPATAVALAVIEAHK